MIKFTWLILFIYLFTGCNNILSNSSSSNQQYSDDNQTYYDDTKSRNDFYGYGKLNLTKLLTQTTTLDSTAEFEKGELFSEQWALHYDEDFYTLNGIDENAHINPTTVYKNFTGSGVTVAIIDDGFDINHPEIRDKIIAKIAFDEYGNSSSDVSHTLNREYHGTAVAGIVAAKSDTYGVNGIAPGVNLILIKMPVSLTSSVVIDMFDFAIDNGADVINCSWGTGVVSDIVREKLNSIANSNGVVTVFASGNDNINMEGDESAIENVVGVGATEHTNLRVWYSNYGKELDVVAPGGYKYGISTIDPIGTKGISNDGYNRYDEYSNGEPVSFIGTSAAAPIVSGAIALLLEANSSLSFDEVMEYLQVSSDKISQNLPYLNEMIYSSSSTPRISGTLSEDTMSTIFIRLVSISNEKVYGKYSISIDGINWYAQVTEELPNGLYRIEVIDDVNNILATDEIFEIDTFK